MMLYTNCTLVYTMLETTNIPHDADAAPKYTTNGPD